MSRITTPASIDVSPVAAQPLLAAVKKQLGSVPNLFRIVGNSPAALEGYLGLNGALGKGALDGKTRERIAVAVAELNGCDYCLSAHNYLGAHVAKLDPAELDANRDGTSADPKADAALRFATRLVRERGHVSAADVDAVKAAGYGDAEVVEIIAHVALNTLTNYRRARRHSGIPDAQVAARARLQTYQGGLDFRSKPDRRSVRLRERRRSERVVARPWQRTMGVRRAWPHAATRGEHQRRPNRRGPAAVPLAARAAARRAPRAHGARLVRRHDGR